MSGIIKVITEAAIDTAPVLLLIGIVYALTLGGGMAELVSMLSVWLLG